LARRILVSIAVLLLAGSGRAELNRDPGWLDRYDVAPGCPDASAFGAAVERRVSRPLGMAFEGLRVAVEIHREDVGGSRNFLGQLHMTEAAARSTRSVEASSCAELVEALSLVAALSARAAPGEQMSTTPLSGPPSRSPALASELHDQAPPPVTAIASDALTLGPAFFVLMQSAVAPRPELGVGLGLTLSLPARGPWAPWLQLGGYRMQSDELPIEGSAVRAHFDLSAAYAMGCPIRIPARGAWSLQPCVDTDLGRLSGAGKGSAVTHTTRRSGLWASTGLALRAEVAPFGPLRLATWLGATVPWTRHEFFFAPDTVAFQVPRVGWRGAVSGAVMF